MSAMEQYLSLKQKQELALKPKMLQSLKMLALPILELESYIKQELVNNPLLELREEKDEDDIDEGNFAQPTPESPTPIEESDTNTSHLETLAEAQELTDILDNWNEYHSGYESWSSDSETEHTESLIRYEENGKDKFLEQLYPFELPEDETDFITDLLDSCDSYGFLPKGFNLNNLAKKYDLTPERAEELHKIVLSLNPQGISARNMAECLLAQLTEEQKQNRILVGLVSEHFENLIHRRYQKIASAYGVSEETILLAKEQVSKLDPKPGLRILSTNAVYVFPDVTMKLIDGKYEIIINDHITPNIIISPRYRKMINRGYFDKETMQFVRERINSAKFLIKSIYMRMRTLERVSLSIINNQYDFFYLGTGQMKPLTYAVIARDLGVNESTISRVVKHKYAETPYGIYAFKDFFTSTAGFDDDYQSISRQKVKSHLIHLIETENKKKPYSDQELVELLKAEGLNISRRIITKYRDELGILNSHLRRE